MNLNDVREWQDFLGEVLIELVKRDGVTVLSPESNRVLDADEVAAACQSGRSIRISVLPASAIETLGVMRRHVKLYRRGIISVDELLFVLKRAWDCLDGLAADWLDALYEQLAQLHELAETVDGPWQAVVVADDCEETLQRIDGLLSGAYTDGP